MNSLSKIWGIWGVLFIAAAWKLLFILLDVVPFNADEAVVGLMARHILDGERPVFFYGQVYMGSLDAYLISALFHVFGVSVLAIRLVQTGLYLLTIFIVYKIGIELFDSQETALFAAAIMAVPAVNVTLYTTASLGGYGEAMVIGCCMMWIAIIWVKRAPLLERSFEITYSILWGFLFGLGLWTNAISLVFGIPAGIAILAVLLKTKNRFAPWLTLLMLVGFFLGSLPWWIYAWQNGIAKLILELTGSAVSVESGSYLSRVIAHLFNLTVLGSTVLLGLRPPWEVRWLALPLIPVILFFWFAIIWDWIKQAFTSSPLQRWYILLLGVPVVFSVCFLLTSFGVDPSGRYFLPLVVPLALVGGNFIAKKISRPSFKLVLLGLLLVFNTWGTIDSAFRSPTGLTTQFDANTAIDHSYMSELIGFLKQEGESCGYTNYWVSYPLIFSSDEEIIYIPRLPYHHDFRYTSRDDRYPPYAEAVKACENPAYITTRHPALDEYLRKEFKNLNITWLEKTIGDYHIFYRLSESVQPEQLSLYEINPVNAAYE